MKQIERVATALYFTVATDDVFVDGRAAKSCEMKPHITTDLARNAVEEVDRWRQKTIGPRLAHNGTYFIIFGAASVDVLHTTRPRALSQRYGRDRGADLHGSDARHREGVRDDCAEGSRGGKTVPVTDRHAVTIFININTC